MENDAIRHRATLWRWSSEGQGNWHFVTIDGAAGEALSAAALIYRLEFGKARGFGSVKVTVEIGGTRWQTSAFPQKGEDA